ncbi:MAG TPA: hypothetical protein VI603_18410 [Saprospiraceae bacterium]|nr:hypothetical protein [Saprospiraceae bacterium]
MKNAMLFAVLAISVDGFAQNKGPITGVQLPSSRSIRNVQLKTEDERQMTSGIYSNKNPGQIDKDRTQEKKWSFSLFGGFSFMGSGADIKRHMRKSGLDDIKPGHQSWFGYVHSKDYPINKIGVVWNFETRYNVSKKSALNFTAGKINHSSVEGYNHWENYLRIKNDLWAASCNYVWRIGKHNDGFSLGPVIARHKIHADSPYPFQVNSSTSSTIKAGFNLGYARSLIQNENWFLTFKANYT